MVLLIAGGSGGHVFPAIALAERVRDLSETVCLMTDQRGARFIKEYSSLFHHIEILPNLAPNWRKKFYIKPFIMVFELVLWWKQTHKFFQQYSIQAIFGFGGFMTLVPMLWGLIWAKHTGKGAKFFALHQSDRVLGRANAFLARWIPVVFTGYPDTLKVSKHIRPVVVGTPVRKAFFQIAPMTLPDTALGILILGGSQGASFWSTVFVNALELLSPKDRSRFQIFHQCPQPDCAWVEQRYQQLSVFCHVCPFFYSLPDILAQVHVVFSRCGASSAAELACCGRSGFFVPYPYAKDQHQDHNAAFWVRHNAGWSCPQLMLRAEKIAEFLQESLEDPQRFLYTGAHAKKLGRKDAAMEMIHYWKNSLLGQNVRKNNDTE